MCLVGSAGVALALAAPACSTEENRKPEAAASGSASATSAPNARSRIEWVNAPDEDDTAGVVRAELARAKAQGQKLLVYVGASWCDPCERFHRAVEAGELDGTFTGVRLVAFDLDRDRERLNRAGYGSKMIPLFALPREDGTGSGAQIEGGFKGDGAVGELVPRLKRFLATGRSES